MSLFTSSHFASAGASGTDWRDTSKAVLEKLESVRTEGHAFNFGFLYISDHLADDALSILNLFKSVLNIEHWIGGIALGVCVCGESFIDMPAISAMITCFDDDAFCMIPPVHDQPMPELERWLKEHEAMLTFVHGDPIADQDPAVTLKAIEELTGGFVLGGLTSSRKSHAQFAGELYDASVCGAVFASDVKVATMLSQGCNVIGETHAITRCDGHTVYEINEQKALSVFENDIRALTMKMTGLDPDKMMVEDDSILHKSEVPKEFQSVLQGEIHAALPISESDQKDYLVRNIIGLDPDKGSILISQHVSNGDRIIFVHRDHDSVYQDLSASLVALRKRVQHEQGCFEPKGAIYISCVARAFNHFDQNGHDNEMALIRDVIGDVPLAGFYAGGEISKARLYGYTGILALFL